MNELSRRTPKNEWAERFIVKKKEEENKEEEEGKKKHRM